MSFLRTIACYPKADGEGLSKNQKIIKGGGDFLEFGMVMTNFILTIMLFNADMECAFMSANTNSTGKRVELVTGVVANEVLREDKCVEAWLYGSSKIPDEFFPGNTVTSNIAHNHTLARFSLALIMICVLGYFFNIIEFFIGLVGDCYHKPLAVAGTVAPNITTKVKFGARLISLISSLITCVLTSVALGLFNMVRFRDTHHDDELYPTGYIYESHTGITFIYVIVIFNIFPLFRDFVKWAIHSSRFASVASRYTPISQVGSADEKYPINGALSFEQTSA